MLTVTVSSPQKILWHGKANSVSSENSQGPFDILPQHANFITFIEKKPIVIRVGKRSFTFHFEKSVIYTQNNYVSCYAI